MGKPAKSLAKIKGTQLRALRDARDLSRGDVATTCDVDEKTVARWERGETPLPDDALDFICEKYRVTAAFFYDANYPLTNTPLMSLTAAGDVLRALESVSLERRQMTLAILFDDSSLAPELPGLDDALKKLAQVLSVSKPG